MLCLSYPAVFERAEEGGFMVTFRDVPEAITQGETMEEAKEYALDALITSADFYSESGRPFPEPSPAEPDEVLIYLPVLTAAKLLLRNIMTALKVRPSELAKKLNTTPSDVSRLLNLRHASKIDSVERAVNSLGYRLNLSASPAEPIAALK